VGGLAGWISGGKKAAEQMKEMKEQFVEGAGGMSALTMRAQAAGASLDKLFAAKDAKDLEKAMVEVQKTIDAFEGKMNGLKDARAAAESLMDRVAKGGFSEKFSQAVGVMVQKVQDALLASGLGFMATGPLRESEAFQGAQGAASDVAQLLAGMRAGGVLDAGVMGAAATSATELQAQAVEAAKAAGLAPAEATKAGFGAIAPLLREQLNASIASGQELDANTKALIEEAKANGVTILADPMVESVAVQKSMLGELKRLNNAGGGVPDESFASGTKGLRLVKRDMLARIHAGEGMLVVPKEEMSGLSFRSFARGTEEGGDPYEGRGFDLGGGTGSGLIVPTSTTGTGGESSQTTAANVEAAVERAVSKVKAVQVNNAPTVTIVDNSVVRTVEGQKRFERETVGAITQALQQNNAGLESQIRRIIRSEAA
jgi:hypothetical protein